MTAKKHVETLPVVDEPTPLPQPLACRKPPTLALPPDAPVSMWHHNFNLALPADKAAFINASNAPDWRPSDGDTFTTEATHYLCYPDTYTDRETGEVVEATSAVFVSRDGKLIKFLNEWSLRRLHALMALYTDAEWAAGIKMEFYAKPSRHKGRTYGSFKVIPPTSPAQES